LFYDICFLSSWTPDLSCGLPSEIVAANPVDTDEPAHMNWLFEQASARAAEHNINGVTFKLVQGVVKNIIPAIASTNAVVAASCANEAFKIATSAATYMNNYMM
jgi:ubiquitin-activating enzyme E1 C